jgi:signal recognition particle subunit SRP54
MRRFQKGRFDMNDLATQLEQMLKMGGMSGIVSMLPGMGKIQKQMDEAGVDDRVLKRQIAIVRSMTKAERKNPDLMKASRKERVAKGAGMEVQDVNRLLKMHRQMADMMKKVGRMGGKKAMRGMLGQMMGKGGMPGMPSGGAGLPGAGALPPGFPGLGGGQALPPGLSGLGRKK